MRKLLLLLMILLSACGPLVPPQTPLPVATTAGPLATVTLLAASPEASLTPGSAEAYPPAVSAALQQLASRLDLPLKKIQVSSIVPQDWPDACLGTASADDICAQVITPGYKIVFTAAGQQYEYHTDAQGKNLRPVSGQTASIRGEQAGMFLEWSGPDCAKLSVSTVSVLYSSNCAETPLAAPGLNGVTGEEPLKSWAKSFAPFEAETPAGKIKFIGFGDQLPEYGKSIATPADQRMMAEWAKLQYTVVQAGRAGAAWGLAFVYHQEGGFAGFCDDLAVYLDGHALLSSCKGQNTMLYLTASEMQQVYAWFDDLRQIDYSKGERAKADGMKISLALSGQGQKTADDATLQAILNYAAGLLSQARFGRQAAPDVADAELALIDYFKALNSGDFSLAARLYGGPTDLLQTWNPDIKDDLPAWLTNACEHNGLVCLLPRSVRLLGPDERGGYKFFVEFNNADGSLFVQGPCCGETSGPSFSRFTFSVLPLPSGTGWQVMDLPPYVP